MSLLNGLKKMMILDILASILQPSSEVEMSSIIFCFKPFREFTSNLTSWLRNVSQTYESLRRGISLHELEARIGKVLTLLECQCTYL